MTFASQVRFNAQNDLCIKLVRNFGIKGFSSSIIRTTHANTPLQQPSHHRSIFEKKPRQEYDSSRFHSEKQSSQPDAIRDCAGTAIPWYQPPPTPFPLHTRTFVSFLSSIPDLCLG